MLPFPFSLYRYFFPRRGHAIDIPSVKVYEIDTAPEKPARALKHLLKLNHANHSILYNERRFHNHAPHVCTLPFLFFSPHNFFWKSMESDIAFADTELHVPARGNRGRSESGV